MSYFRHHVFCCENLREPGHSRGCCAEKGSVALREYLKEKIKSLGLNGAGKIRINASGCLDRCEMGPVIVVYPEGIWYHLQDRSDVDAVVEEHLIGGRIVERLRLSDMAKR